MSAGLPFPTELIQILIKDEQENYRVTTFRNVQFNATDPDGYYTYSVGNGKVISFSASLLQKFRHLKH